MSSAYLFSILATAAIFTLLALSLNIITGYAGQAMMGIAAFFGIGAYTAAIITTHGGNFLLALLAAIVVSGICGAVLGVISLRLQADFLAITTIGINFVMAALFNSLKITGGTLGLTTTKPVVFGIRMTNLHFFIFTTVLIIIVCLLITKMICWSDLSIVVHHFCSDLDFDVASGSVVEKCDMQRPVIEVFRHQDIVAVVLSVPFIDLFTLGVQT